jgi:hypothetical protein
MASCNGDAGSFCEILAHPHGDVVRRRLGARPVEMHIFPHDELKRAAERGFERRDIHLAISLGGAGGRFEHGRAGGSKFSPSS